MGMNFRRNLTRFSEAIAPKGAGKKLPVSLRNFCSELYLITVYNTDDISSNQHAYSFTDLDHSYKL